MTDTLHLPYIQDPGHGWIEISRRQARQLLGADFARISPFSYQRGALLYLEEDCDAALLIQACQRAGLTLALEERHCPGEASIRHYDSFRA